MELSWSIKLEIADINHLIRFKQETNFSGPIFNCFKKKVPQNTKKLTINSKYWGNDLKENFGVIPNKTRRLTPPKLNSDLLKFCFLLGYIDGDGCICLVDRKSKNETELCFSIVSCSFDILIFFKDLIDKYFMQYKLRNKHQIITQCTSSTSARNVRFAGMQALMFLDFFKDFPVPLLQRKWQNPKALEFLAQKKLEYPNFFTLSPDLQNIKNQILTYQPSTPLPVSV